MKGAIVAEGYIALSTSQREKHSIEAHESSVVLVLTFLFSVNGVIDRGERFLTRPLRLLTALLHTLVWSAHLYWMWSFCEMVDMWVQLYHSLTLMEEEYSKPKISTLFIHSYILHEITNRNKKR